MRLPIREWQGSIPSAGVRLPRKCEDKLCQCPPKLTFAFSHREYLNFLLLGLLLQFRIARFRHETNDLERWEMLAAIGSLLDSDFRLSFHHENVEALPNQ